MTAPAISTERVRELREWCRPLATGETRAKRQPPQCWETLTAICDRLLALEAAVGEANAVGALEYAVESASSAAREMEWRGYTRHAASYEKRASTLMALAALAGEGL